LGGDLVGGVFLAGFGFVCQRFDAAVESPSLARICAGRNTDVALVSHGILQGKCQAFDLHWQWAGSVAQFFGREGVGSAIMFTGVWKKEVWFVLAGDVFSNFLSSHFTMIAPFFARCQFFVSQFAILEP
jgi:hypothetical protein